MKAMINIIFTFLVILAITTSSSAQQADKGKRELKTKKQEKKKEDIKILVEEKNFVFKPTHAMPLGGGSISLSHSFDAEIRGDTLFSYLPFFGVAYNAEYGARKSALDFTQPLQNFELETTRKGYQVKLDVKNKMDFLSYTFFISEQGFATLNVNSTNRQSISFYGRIEATRDDK